MDNFYDIKPHLAFPPRSPLSETFSNQQMNHSSSTSQSLLGGPMSQPFPGYSLDIDKASHNSSSGFFSMSFSPPNSFGLSSNASGAPQSPIDYRHTSSLAPTWPPAYVNESQPYEWSWTQTSGLPASSPLGRGGLADDVKVQQQLSPSSSSQASSSTTSARPFVCSFPGCEKTYKKRGHLQAHERMHTGEKKHVCMFPVPDAETFGTTTRPCGMAFLRCDQLTRHRREHSVSRPFHCPYCEKSFKRSDHRTAHMRRHPNRCSPAEELELIKRFTSNDYSSRTVRAFMPRRRRVPEPNP